MAAVTAPVASTPQERRRLAHDRLLVWVGVALAIRLLLALLPYAFWTDVNTFKAWSMDLVQHGPGQFYYHGWADYPPAYLLFLWIWGHLYRLFFDPHLANTMGMGLTFWMKLPGCLADVANGYVIYRLLAGRVSTRSATRAAMAYLFNPVCILVSAVWGQMDPVLVTVMLGVAWATVDGAIVRAGALTAFGILLKPQGLFIAPMVVLARWYQGGRKAIVQWVLAIVSGLVVAELFTLPFYREGNLLWGPFGFLFRRYLTTANQYPDSSVNAYNLWALTGMWLPDDRTVLGLPHRVWGLAFLAALLVALGVYLYRRRTASAFYLATATFLLGDFLLATRMHERYVFPALAFLAIAQGFNPRVKPLYRTFTATAFVNLAMVLLYYNHGGTWFDPIQAFMVGTGNPLVSGIAVVVLVNMWCFGELLGLLFGTNHGKLAFRAADAPSHPLDERSPGAAALAAGAPAKAPAWTSSDTWAIGGIALAFYLVGLIRLAFPDEQIFDEVYHARTANEYLHGISPYEWTHPPLAKLIIAVGIKLFGMNSFGWRIPSLVAGTLGLVAMYALARRVIGTTRGAALATGLLAMDGVYFVQSRVAMTNVYTVAFLLLACLGVWAYMQEGRDRWLVVAGLGFGCAISTRWSGLYGYAGALALLFAHWAFNLRPTRTAGQNAGLWAKAIAALVGIPAVVYLLSYIPYMRQGHNLGEVLGMQKAMYGYHANLHATHTYASPWFSWPIMWRPTWYYFHDFGNQTIAGIDCIGNPAIWWAVVPAVALLLVWTVRRRSWAGAFLLAMFGSLYGAWALQGVTSHGRSLVFMHYMLEAVPFAVIGLGLLAEAAWRTSRGWKVIPLGYMALVAALAAYFYPLWAGLPIAWTYYHSHIWFPTWI